MTRNQTIRYKIRWNGLLPDMTRSHLMTAIVRVADAVNCCNRFISIKLQHQQVVCKKNNHWEKMLFISKERKTHWYDNRIEHVPVELLALHLRQVQKLLIHLRLESICLMAGTCNMLLVMPEYQ